ncbi:MAG: DUF89 family protein [Actinobacteria bacterium]|nr:DUF89 family protein [Actinomycetota bacterium]
MKFLPDCYSCVMRQASSAAKLVSDDRSFQDECMRETAGILSRDNREMTPPAIGELMYHRICEISGNQDPFKRQKEKQNDAASKLLPWLRETVNAASDPLLMAVRIAIAGNVVDPGAHESFDLESTVMEAVVSKLNLDAYPLFRRNIENAHTILHIADNCGEIVFDRVLVETILSLLDVRIVVAVRDVPIINDATMKDAAEVGMTNLCRVISSGSRMPGTSLSRTTPEFQELFRNSDLVISKGQGNWETLEDCDRDLYFMFQVKCQPVSVVTGCSIGQPVLAYHEP